ncbi:MAG: DUF4292 domain-containing protein [Deltaproteobacteria bacterium]|nr:DUF4292 domain-containing protein [Deltaproteobacteria bacterium]MBI3077516.1 DUF4292 domain-containing protein [Deltaproteobacteria bacterium]
MAALREAESRVAALRGLALLTVKAPLRSYQAREVIVSRRPASLRLEALGPLDQPLLLAATDGASLQIYSAAENLFLTGQASARNLARLFPVELDLAQVVALVRGTVSLIEAVQARARPVRGGEILLVLEGRALRQEVWLDGGSLRLLRSRLVDDRGEALYEVAFRDYRPVDGQAFPFRIEVEVPAKLVTVHLQYRELALNAETDHEEFRLVAPPGARVENLDGEKG